MKSSAILLLLAGVARAQTETALRLEKTIELPGVQGLPGPPHRLQHRNRTDSLGSACSRRLRRCLLRPGSPSEFTRVAARVPSRFLKKQRSNRYKQIAKITTVEGART